MLGRGAMSNSIGELEDAPFIFAIGTNTTESHPVIAIRLKKAVRKGAKLLVADPRRIDLTRFAYQWMQIRIGSDIALVDAMCSVIVEEGLVRREYVDEKCDGFDELATFLKTRTPEWAEPITGIPAATIRQSARDYATAERAAICYTLGITEHRTGVANVQSLGNLALLTANLGRVSSGVNPFRGQNNVQGTGDMGGMPETLPGYQKVSDPEVREKFSKAWGVVMPKEPGYKKPEAIDAVLEGKIRAMWIVGDNTAVADTDIEKTRAAFEKLELLVVQDIFLTTTARLADVVFPAAASFAEVDGTYANSERRVQRVRKAVEPPGQAKPDWWIVQQVADRMGAGWNYRDAEEIWNEVRVLAPPLTGITYDRIEKEGLQWPCPTTDHPGTKFLHQDGFPIGKAKLMPVDWLPPAEIADADYPFVLTTGRRLSTYHTGTQTGRAEHFDRFIDREWIEMNPADATRLNLTTGEPVRVASRRGAVEMQVRVTERSPRGAVFCSFAFPETTMVNLLSSIALEPTTKTPEFKACAVRIDRVTGPANPESKIGAAAGTERGGR